MSLFQDPADFETSPLFYHIQGFRLEGSPARLLGMPKASGQTNSSARRAPRLFPDICPGRIRALNSLNSI
jgi:hypothetical protein